MKFKIELDLENLIDKGELEFNDLVNILFDDCIWAADRMTPNSAKKLQRTLDCYNEE